MLILHYSLITRSIFFRGRLGYYVNSLLDFNCSFDTFTQVQSPWYKYVMNLIFILVLPAV